MTAEDKEFLKEIDDYAEDVLKDIDPQKTQISAQLEKLMPVLNDVAKKSGKSPEDIFIRYMDLCSERIVENEKKLRDSLSDIDENPS